MNPPGRVADLAQPEPDRLQPDPALLVGLDPMVPGPRATIQDQLDPALVVLLERHVGDHVPGHLARW